MLCTAVPSTEDAFTSRLLQSTIQALELYGIYLGKELGLYAALKSCGPLTGSELAREAGIAPRYAREWLEQQAVAGVLVVEQVSAPADERRYRLPGEHVNVLEHLFVSVRPRPGERSPKAAWVGFPRVCRCHLRGLRYQSSDASA